MVSSPLLALGMLGPSLIASHASASLSGTGLTGGIISGGGATSGVGKTPGVVGRGMGEGIIITPSVDVEFSDCVGVGWDRLERRGVGGLFILQKRDLVSVGSLACRRWGGLFELSEEPPPASASASAERARFGWLNFLNTWAKDIVVTRKDGTRHH